MASLLSVRRGVGPWGGGVTGVRVTLMAVGADEGLGIDLAGNGEAAGRGRAARRRGSGHGGGGGRVGGAGDLGDELEGAEAAGGVVDHGGDHQLVGRGRLPQVRTEELRWAS